MPNDGKSFKANGRAALWFGTKDETWCVITAKNINEEAAETEELDGEGNIICVVHTGFKKPYDVTVRPLEDGEGAPALGANDFLVGTRIPMKYADGTEVELVCNSNAISLNQAASGTMQMKATFYPLINGAG